MDTIIYFGNSWFSENRTSSHHIAGHLSEQFRVLYVECPGLRMPQRSKRDLSNVCKKVMSSLTAPKQISPTMYIHTLFQIPLHGIAVVRRINEKLILLSLKRAMRRLGISDPLLWFHAPHLACVPGKLRSKGVVYYCIDSYSSLPNVDKAAVQSMDDEMTRKADIVFVSSTPLYEGKAHIAREIIFSPHGVDIDHFSRSSAMADGVPEDIKSLNKPILGFWGLIEERIDLDLIKYLATRNPEWNFVLIGHVAVKDNPCSEVANVHFLGPKKYDELPSYGKLFDVALLPYKLNDFVFNCNPIKLREYLATGCPVVSTRYPEIEKYQEVASIADDYASFEGMIWWHLANDSQEMFDQRINRIKAESWQNRCNEIVAKLKLKFGLEGGAV